jgi:hypothetical protein
MRHFKIRHSSFASIFGAVTFVFGMILGPVHGSAAISPAVRLTATYLAAGEKMLGTIVLDDRVSAPTGAILRITEFRQLDISASEATKLGASSCIILERPVTDAGANDELKFDIDAADMLVGTIRVQAEIIQPSQHGAVASAWAEPITVGLRNRVSLAGTWDVGKIEPYDYPAKNRPKGWKPPEVKDVTLPGALTRDEWFRGWITVRRDVKWEPVANLKPRFIRMSGLADSALVSVDGVALPETRPIEDMAVLSHWIEFHSAFKGEANANTRLLFLDLLPQGPVKLALTAAPHDNGKASIQMRIRGTSGMFRPRPVMGVIGDLYLEMTPSVYVRDISFDTDKPGENRRFKFQLKIENETGSEFHGNLRGVFGRYDGKIAYTGNCPAYGSENQAVVLKPGENVVEIVREEKPRFDTCRATFLLVDSGNKIIDGDSINFHTVTMEIRDRRDFYLNNERFIVKGQGSSGDAPHKRWQLRLMGGNAFRGPTDPDQINLYESEGLLTSCGPLVASVEKCTFYNPNDTSNIFKAVKGYTSALSDCPGVIIWEATNELHGDPEEARVAILDAFHKLDPYHRPVLATKGGGEWEADARDGRVKGVDIVGCQYLLSKEEVDSLTSAVTEQPIMSTEVNWNDISFSRDKLWQYWLDKGITGSLLFDYSGSALDQPAPLVPPPDTLVDFRLIRKGNRDMYQDLVATAVRQPDGKVLVKLGNQMPYTLHGITVRAKEVGRFDLPDLAPGAAATILIPREQSPAPHEPAIVRAEYFTHGGLPHVAILTPTVTDFVGHALKGDAK